MDGEAFKEEVRSRCDIVDIVRGYLPLKPGGGTFKGLCPFHREKSPSFNVDPRRQIFHCFGCGEGGDVFSFIQRIEGVDFPGAMELLAAKAGLRYEASHGGSGTGNKERDELRQLHVDLTAWYEELLHTHPEAASARAYLKKRALPLESIKAFRLGYALDSFDATRQWGQAKGYSESLMEKGGVVKPRSGGSGTYDTFRGRLMFPISDQVGRPIGFSARILVKNDEAPKYVNSPETLLFKKSQVLYALDKARQAMVETRQALICEGQIDVIRCHSVGLTQAIAAQGTALTESHATRIKNYVDEVVLVLDADKAGENAAIKSAGMFLAQGLPVRVATLPEGEDPDSLILKEGREAFETIIRSASELMDFQIRVLSGREADKGTPGKMRVVKSVLETISQASGAVQREDLLERAGRQLGITSEALKQDLAPVLRQQRKQAPAPHPEQTADTPPLPAPVRAAPTAQSPMPREETMLLEIMHQYPEVLPLAEAHLAPASFAHPCCAALFEIFVHRMHLEHADWPARLPDYPEGLQPLGIQIAMQKIEASEETGGALSAIQELILIIRRKQMERRRNDLAARSENDSASVMEQGQLTLVMHQLKAALQRHDWQAAVPILEVWPPDG